MNRIKKIFQDKSRNILSIYFTAGHPEPNRIMDILKHLQENEVDMIEIGIPFSDPMADGPVIQASSEKALKNGTTLSAILKEIQSLRDHIHIPVLIMSYLNPLYRYGFEKFLREISTIGIDGLIIPDLPLEVYEKEYRVLFENLGLQNIFLVSPSTKKERITEMDIKSNSFIYFVSSNATTGQNFKQQDKTPYFRYINELRLKNAKMIGFGIGDHQGFLQANQYADGAIIGSAFINALDTESDLNKAINNFIQNIRTVQKLVS